MELIFFLWLLCGAAAGIIAAGKHRNGCGWFLGGILLGPFALLLAYLQDPPYRCPQCRKGVEKDATKCPHCQSRLDDPLTLSSGVKLREPKVDVAKTPTTKLCPFCAEPIQSAARKCRYCGEFLTESF